MYSYINISEDKVFIYDTIHRSGEFYSRKDFARFLIASDEEVEDSSANTGKKVKISTFGGISVSFTSSIGNGDAHIGILGESDFTFDASRSYPVKPELTTGDGDVLYTSELVDTAYFCMCIFLMHDEIYALIKLSSTSGGETLEYILLNCDNGSVKVEEVFKCSV